MKKLLILTTILLVSMAGCKKEPSPDNSGEPLLKEGRDVMASLDSRAQTRSFEYTENGKRSDHPGPDLGICSVIEYTNYVAADTLNLVEPQPVGNAYIPTTHKGEWYEINVYDDRVEVTVDENSAAESRGIKFDMSTLPFFCTVTLTQSGAR